MPVVFDEAIMTSVRQLIPAVRLRAYLFELDRQLAVVVDNGSSDASLQERAHKIISQAGMLGLLRMSHCARILEDACRSGIGQADALQQCRLAVGDIEHFAMPAAGAGYKSLADNQAIGTLPK